MNKEPSFNLNIIKDGESTIFEANRDNTSLYRHIGSLAVYNHAYIDLGDNLCTRVWRHNDSYEKVESFMIANDYPIHDNLRQVNKHDADAYDDMISRQMTDLEQIPEGWE